MNTEEILKKERLKTEHKTSISSNSRRDRLKILPEQILLVAVVIFFTVITVVQA